MKRQRILIGILILGLLLTLAPAAPARAGLNPGTLDTGFDPGTGADDVVTAIVCQPDGKVLIGGTFTQVDGETRSALARLEADGTLDTGFAPIIEWLAGSPPFVSAIALQPDGKILVGGHFTKVNGEARSHIARLNADGTLDTGFAPVVETIGMLVFPPVVRTVALQPDGKVLIGGSFAKVNGEARGHIARLNDGGTLDASFAADTNDLVQIVAVQPDDKVLVGGSFTQINGTTRNRVARLETDGSLDTGFGTDTGVEGIDVFALAVQPDGKVLVGGAFDTVGGKARSNIARLETDGSVDTGFLTALPGVDDWVMDVAIQPDGKILVGGRFANVNGVARNHIAQLDDNGTLDTSFDPGTGANDWVYAVTPQPDGKVLVGGDFTDVDGTARNRIARVNADGTLDTGFDTSSGANAAVVAVAFQTDGKVIIGGGFTQVQGVARNSIARLNADGTLDAGFDPDTDGLVWDVVVQPGGKILVGGLFTTIAGQSCNGIAQLNADGTLDTAFDPGAGAEGGAVTAIALQDDGQVLIAGAFTTVAGQSRNGIARLSGADGTLDASFDPGTGANLPVFCVAVQPSGHVIVGGAFTTMNGAAQAYVARLETGGTLDTSFDPIVNSSVWATAVQDDGQVLIGGTFSTVDGVGRVRIARLDASGALDTGFDPGIGANDLVRAIAPQADGKVLVGGKFTEVAVVGKQRNRIARLNADGTLDAGFDTSDGANDWVQDVAVQPNGLVLIGGYFTQVNSQPHERVARLNGATSPVFTSATPSLWTTLGAAYSHNFATSGFPLPTFYVSGGSLPPGLALDGVTGILAGVPTAAGTYSFTVTASNHVAPSDSQAVNVTVGVRVYLPLVMNGY